MKKFPKQVKGIGGKIKVMLLPMLEKTDKGEETAGRYYADKREIHVLSTQTVKEQWLTLYHELIHAALADSGMTHLLTQESEEAFSDLIGLARVIEDGL